MRSRSRSWCLTGAKACSRSFARSAAWSGPSTSTAGPWRGGGRPAMSRGGSRPIRLTEKPDHTSDLADQADVAGHDRLVGRVFGDQLDVAVLPLEALDCGVAFDQGDHDGAVGSLVLGADEHQVVIEDAGVDHAVAANPEQEVAVLRQVGREQDVVFDVLLRQDRAPGGHVAHDGDRDGVAPLLGDLRVGDQLDRARLAGVALDQAAPLELVEVVVDGRARAQADRLADLAHARRVVADLGHVPDVVEDLVLPFGELFGQFVFISRAWWGDAEAMLALRASTRKPLFGVLTGERPFGMLPNVCTLPVTGSNLGGHPVPAAFLRCGDCWRQSPPFPCSGSDSRWGRTGAPRPATRWWSSSRATRCGRSPWSTIRRMMFGSVSTISSRPTAWSGRRSRWGRPSACPASKLRRRPGVRRAHNK